LLIQNKHDPGCVGADLIFRDLHAIHRRHAFQVSGNLLQSVPLCRFGGQSDPVLSRIAIAHAVFALSIDDPDFRERGGGEHRDQEGHDEYCNYPACSDGAMGKEGYPMS